MPLGPDQTVLLRGQAHAQPSWALDTSTGSDVRSVALGLPPPLQAPSSSAVTCPFRQCSPCRRVRGREFLKQASVATSPGDTQLSRPGFLTPQEPRPGPAARASSPVTSALLSSLLPKMTNFMLMRPPRNLKKPRDMCGSWRQAAVPSPHT